MVVARFTFSHSTSMFVCQSGRLSVFRFRMLTSKHQWIFTKVVMRIDILVIWFGIANRQISSGIICPRHAHILVLDDNLCKCQGVLTKLGTCIDIKEVRFWFANGQTFSVFNRFVCLQHYNGRVLLFYVFIFIFFFFYCSCLK